MQKIVIFLIILLAFLLLFSCVPTTPAVVNANFMGQTGDGYYMFVIGNDNTFVSDNNTIPDVNWQDKDKYTIIIDNIIPGTNGEIKRGTVSVGSEGNGVYDWAVLRKDTQEGNPTSAMVNDSTSNSFTFNGAGTYNLILIAGQQVTLTQTDN